MRIVVAGAVGSTRRTLLGLLRHHCGVVGVLELCPDAARHVSGYAPLHDIAQDAGVACAQFTKINEARTVSTLREWRPDLLFVVGLSQIVQPKVLGIPTLGCVGFHPTALPLGRGRAPLAWLTWDGTAGAATFFLIDDGVDSGPILVQEPFPVASDAYASDVTREMEAAIDRALDRWLPSLLDGRWDPQHQDDSLATYNGRRSIEDGLIDWNCSAHHIHKLIRATSRPHPGAYTYWRENKLVIWRAEVSPDSTHRGVPGRILEVNDTRGPLVQTGHGLLWLSEIEPLDGTLRPIRVGAKLGYVLEDEVFQLRQRVFELEQRLARLETNRRVA